MSPYSLLMCLLVLVIASCSHAKNSPGQQSNTPFQPKDSLTNHLGLTDKTDQKKAMDALNEIQLSGGGKLYSTFANIAHRECTGAIKEYVISSTAFETALLELLNKNYQHLPVEQRKYLASIAAQAQAEYPLTVCGATSFLKDTTTNSKPPYRGTWIFPAILEQRDVVVVW